MITAQALAACLMLASHTYQVPPAVMIGIMHVEGGRVGQEVGPNFNGTYDLGPMQVNTAWVPMLARAWGLDQRTARAVVRDDGCVNVKVAAWILHKGITETGSVYGGIAHYHSATPWLGVRYADRVIAVMDRKGLIRHDAPLPGGHYYKYAQK
jgi:soluble lytic murein transglycosylase-like protein